MTNKSGSWEITPIYISDVYAGVFPNIALDTNDAIHITYSDSKNDIYLYLTNKSGEWIASTIEAYGYAPSAFGFNSLAIGQENTAHITYFDYNYSDRNLNYVHFKPAKFDASGTWTFETSGNWVDDPGKCTGDKDGSDSGTIEQNENSVSGILGGVEFNGSVSGAGYEFFGFDTDPATEIKVSITASTGSNASGVLTMAWFTGSYNCTGGSNITLKRIGSSGGATGGGGGSGGCFISNSRK